ncbi:hypothetical protein GALMADRAFT_137846 [Galerina marginata CBS 339.88]|uniref:Uncharacterized protein n=1 Tax=Galerina marginata (strain CBS 339.88) TaxID=685588 RepID=A0A067TG24_GALM3|nr:hypothetical protein GALMADRAFT_137846 [Galerina marginata CBS 339.88]
MRRLALHASALSDAEYEVYTACLRDLVDEDTHFDGKGKGSNEKAGELEDDAYFERMHVGVREARAWLRGRYAGVGTGAIDAILRLFSPTLAHGDTLSGSEFFAALRLVTHADNGNDGGGVDRSLAFVQAVPSQKPSRSTPSASQPSSPAKRPVQLPPPMPSRRTYTESSIAPSSSSSTARAPDSMPHDHYYSHQQPPLHPSQRTESFKSVSVSGSGSVTGASTSHSAFNPFVPRAPRSEDGSRLPPLPPRKPPPPIPPPRNNSSHRVDRSLSPSKFAATPLPALVSASPSGAGESSQPYPNQNPYASTSANPYPNSNPHPSPHPKPPPPVPPPKHVTSTLMKQSLHASKVAQTMKRAEAQLEKERVMQVLKSSSIVSGSYSLAGARVSGSSVVVGTNIHNQHQYQQHHPAQVNQHGQGNHQELRHNGHAPQIGQLGQTRNTSPARYSSSGSSVSASISDAAPPLPRRRHQHQYQQQPSPPLSASSLEQVALAAPPVPPSFSSGPPSTSTGRTSSRTHDSHSIADSESTSAYMYAQSPFRSPPPPPPPTNTTVNDSPEGSRSPSPTRAYAHGGAEFPSGPPPTHPDRKPLGYFAYQSPSRSNSNLESFEAVYGPGPAPSTSSPFTTPSGVSPSTPTAGTPMTPNFPRVFRSKSMHQTSSPPIAPLSEPPPLAPRRKRPESVQVLSSVDVLAGSLSRGSSVIGHGPTPSVSGHVQGQHRRSSLSVSSTPSSHPQAHSQSGHGHDHSHSPFSMNSLQKTIAGLQPKLDKARYKAEAGLSRRGFVRDAGGRAKFGVEGEEEEGLMPMERGRRPVGTGTGTGKERERPTVHRRWTSRGDVDGDEGFFDEPQVGDHAEEEVDGDEDEWTRSRGMGVDVSASPVRRRLAGGEEDTEEDVFGPASPARRRGGGGGGKEVEKGGRAGEEGMEQDNLKWPAGEGWKPL